MARRWDNGRVPLPPMPTDPSICRWCDGPMLTNGICAASCLPADTKEYLLTERRCLACQRKHRTGRTSDLDMCSECLAAERNRYASQAVGERPRQSAFLDHRQHAVTRRARELQQKESA